MLFDIHQSHPRYFSIDPTNLPTFPRFPGVVATTGVPPLIPITLHCGELFLITELLLSKYTPQAEHFSSLLADVSFLEAKGDTGYIANRGRRRGWGGVKGRRGWGQVWIFGGGEGEGRILFVRPKKLSIQNSP